MTLQVSNYRNLPLGSLEADDEKCDRYILLSYEKSITCLPESNHILGNGKINLET